MNWIGRRTALKNLGLGGVTLLAGARCDNASPTGLETSTTTTTTTTSAATSSPACVLTPALTEGPYYFDAGLIRQDITEGRPGVPLELGFALVQASSCSPIRDALVDIWHCDALGVYSGYSNEGTAGARFLRGIQVTDGDGRATFSTLYPGWYAGRTVHIHMKIHLDERTALTSQLFFPESVSDEVYARSPYDSRGSRTTTNASDGIFSQDTVLEIVPAGDGYSASIVIGVSS